MRDVAVDAPCRTTTVRLEGNFDASAAARTLRRIDELACDRVVIDFAHVWEMSDIALAFLAGGLARHPHSKDELAGLRSHHDRLLHDLGVASLVGRPRHPDQP